MLPIALMLALSAGLASCQDDPPVINPKFFGRFVGEPPIQPRQLEIPNSSRQTSCSCGVLNPDGATRIVGGTQTNDGEIPWRVAIFIGDSSGSGHICGGTIISKNWVLTAAHCTYGTSPSTHQVLVFTGAQDNPITVGGGTQYRSDRWVNHPAYSDRTKDNDVALIHISTPITYASNVSPACLPWNLATTSLSGVSVLASGWGSNNLVPVGVDNEDPPSDTLMKVTLPFLTTEQCRQYIPNLTNNMVCTYQPGYDTCQGDSGGSIDYQGSSGRYYAVGVVSWGWGCAAEDAPGVYAKVTNYLSWIQTTTAENYCKI